MIIIKGHRFPLLRTYMANDLAFLPSSFFLTVSLCFSFLACLFFSSAKVLDLKKNGYLPQLLPHFYYVTFVSAMRGAFLAFCLICLSHRYRNWPQRAISYHTAFTRESRNLSSVFFLSIFIFCIRPNVAATIPCF